MVYSIIQPSVTLCVFHLEAIERLLPGKITNSACNKACSSALYCVCLDWYYFPINPSSILIYENKFVDHRIDVPVLIVFESVGLALGLPGLRGSGH